jgi:hypothetical protein
MWIKKFLFLAFLFFIFSGHVLSRSFVHMGLISLWGLGSFEKSSKPQLGLRYIPEFSLAFQLSDTAILDTEVSFNAFGTALFKKIDDVQTDGDIDPFRLWLRFSFSQFEARIGLQKINFGSASLLRPLMWFDSLDPRDPLQLTDGVYGLLLRYFFVNNTNIWLWGLYGNDKTKGREAIPTQQDSVEYGGRLQFPLFTGELAVTYHHRRADFEKSSMLPLPPGRHIAPENRVALDGKWDMGIGIWFEGSLIHQNNELLPMPWQRALNVGLDYTFQIGNGLYILAEHFNFARTQEAFQSGDDSNFSAMLMRYPLSLLDEITGIIYFDWENEEWYRFFSWQRTYDRWRINVIGFWNPENLLIYPIASGNNSFAGKGFQVTIIFNY